MEELSFSHFYFVKIPVEEHENFNPSLKFECIHIM